MRNVLVVAYYFPPMGFSGVHRVSKFVKYLPEFGWQPTVLTVEPAGYFAYDASPLRELRDAGVEIRRTGSLDPTRFFGRRRTVRLPSEQVRSRLSSISQCLFIPDNKVGWLPYAVRAGNSLVRLTPFDAVFSSAPPYTAHLVAARLSRRHGIPLLVDFRDDWVGNPRHVYPTPLHARLNARMERRVLCTSRHAVTINGHIREALLERNPLGPRVTVIPHGYDSMTQGTANAKGSDRMRFVYTGVFYDAQTPDYFLRALARVIGSDATKARSVEAVFVGLLPDASKRLITDLDLGGNVCHVGYVSHADAVAWQRSADVLWMTIGSRPGAEGISTGKLFEYMGNRKPILALVPPGTARDALARYGAAMVVDPHDVIGIEEVLLDLFDNWESGKPMIPDEDFVGRFDRRVLAEDLAALLDECATPE